ncbi:N-acetylmuramoyl-L-alanine amidase [Gottschalkia purinilytica]|uniref:N-acetylmuramoyl-L-alanine amidase n=1 Tax=Gottschalkia purinilytica TaxID=1503 RepID=A0A0L0W8R7_GOTPU|nr:N-acetylmuramoyl-L-alanine amidase [Gottschalkia purinilytica]KNF07842.1 N-acetylmuramoyl-L-alanine amidase [Gottschalkia purinilytica]
MNYVVDHIPNSKSKRPGTKLNSQYLTIHSTGNPDSTARNERGWLTNPSNTNSVSWHIVVDEKEVIEAIPLNEISHHAGSSEGNNTSIGIEMCESGNREAVIQNTVKLVAKLLKERGWGVDRLRRHYDWIGKNCPRILNYNNWEGWTRFKNLVQAELGGNNMVTLRKGDSGDLVYKLQADLLAIGYTEVGKPDGIFGTNTENAVKRFQRDYGLSSDGIAGKNTLNKIQEVLKSMSEHWGAAIKRELESHGVVISEERYDDNITRAESMVLALQVIKAIKGIK